MRDDCGEDRRRADVLPPGRVAIATRFLVRIECARRRLDASTLPDDVRRSLFFLWLRVELSVYVVMLEDVEVDVVAVFVDTFDVNELEESLRRCAFKSHTRCVWARRRGEVEERGVVDVSDRGEWLGERVGDEYALRTTEDLEGELRAVRVSSFEATTELADDCEERLECGGGCCCFLRGGMRRARVRRRQLGCVGREKDADRVMG